MKEIIINYNNQKKDIIVAEEGKVAEQYQESDDSRTLEGNIYLGKVVDVLIGMQAAFVDIGEDRNAFLHIKDVLPKKSSVTGNKNEKLSKTDIRKYIKVGDSVIVQVKKDKNETKGARISTDINIAGKYVAILPNSNFITVSNKIENADEVNRLKNIAKKVLNDDCGIIFRTAAENKSEETLLKDIENVKELNNQIKNMANECIKRNDYPRKIYEAGGIINKVLLGLIENCDRITVNNKEIYEFIKSDYKDFENKIELKECENLITDDLNIQLEKLKNRKIWLKCGGFITIDRTEALTAIDVNTGKYTGQDSLEKTVVKVNEEASIEIAKQIRARDIGGIIIIDYIDMEEKENEERIIEVLQKELKKDRAKTQIVGFTPLHLLEMTRKHLCSN